MKILLSQRVTFHSALNSAEWHKCIEGFVQQKTWNPGHRHFKPYEGKFDNTSFRISRVINYRNSFLPVIKGKWSPEGTGSKVDLYFRMNGFVIGFCIVWLSFTFFAFLIRLAALLNGNATMFLLIPLIMLAFMLTLIHLAFKYELKRSLPELREKLRIE